MGKVWHVLLNKKFGSESFTLFPGLIHNSDIFCVCFCQTFIFLKVFFDLNKSGSVKKIDIQAIPEKESKIGDLIADWVIKCLSRKSLSLYSGPVTGW